MPTMTEAEHARALEPTGATGPSRAGHRPAECRGGETDAPPESQDKLQWFTATSATVARTLRSPAEAFLLSYPAPAGYHPLTIGGVVVVVRWNYGMLVKKKEKKENNYKELKMI